ncbi:hypothetical protein GCM10022221_18280 [Actinocorallia aurea]
MTEQTPDRRALALLLAALDIPHPATGGDEDNRRRVLADRAMHTAIFLRGYLAESMEGMRDVHLDYFAARLAEHPPTTYAHYMSNEENGR